MTLKTRLLLPIGSALLLFFCFFEFFDYQHFNTTLKTDLRHQAEQLSGLIIASLKDSGDEPTTPHAELKKLRAALRPSNQPPTTFRFSGVTLSKAAIQRTGKVTETSHQLPSPAQFVLAADGHSYLFQKTFTMKEACLSCHPFDRKDPEQISLNIKLDATRVQGLNLDRFYNHLALDATFIVLFFIFLWWHLNSSLLHRLHAFIRVISKRRLVHQTQRPPDDKSDEFDQVMTSFQHLEDRLGQGQQIMREQHLQYEALFYNNHMAMLLVDPEAEQIIDANPAACRFYGYSHREFMGMPIEKINPAGKRVLDEAIVRAKQPTGAIFTFTHQLADRTTREVEVFSGPIQFKGRSLLYSIINDITKRQSALKALAESEDRFRMVAEFTYGWEYWLDPVGKLIYTSPSCSRITGYQARDFLEDPSLIEKIVHPEDLSMFQNHHHKNQGEELQPIDFRIIHKNGTVRWVSHECQLVQGDQGVSQGIRVSVGDITDRKTAEEQLRQSRQSFQDMTERMRVLFDAIPDILLLLNPDLSIVWANQAAVQSSGIAHEDLVGQPCSKARFGRKAPCETCPSAKSFASGKPENSMEADSDGRFWGLRSFPILDQDGKVVQVIELSSDITDRLNLQAETMRTGQLASLGELAAGVAHEINNPINGVINYAQILINQAAKQDQRNEIAERILHESDRIAGIVSNLLSFAREKPEQKGPVALSNVVREALALSEAQLRNNGIQISQDFPEDLPNVIGRHQQLEQVFINLFSNARYALNFKFPEPDPEKRLSIRAVALKQGSIVRVIVEDQGTGIPENVRQKILNPFFSTKPSGEGTGLGLSISHSIIYDHDGTLNFETEVGKYTRVLIDLPSA